MRGEWGRGARGLGRGIGDLAASAAPVLAPSSLSSSLEGSCRSQQRVNENAKKRHRKAKERQHKKGRVNGCHTISSVYPPFRGGSRTYPVGPNKLLDGKSFARSKS